MSEQEDQYRGNQESHEQEERPVEKAPCRDFKKGDCRRGERCIYHHPKLDICRDYQRGRCSRVDCKYVHATRAEEETFDKNGILPSHITNGPFGASGGGGGNRKRDYDSMAAPSSFPIPFGQPSPAPTDLCRDFEKGDCRRGERCKFFHPKLVTCRDFKKGKCDREDCRFLHLTREEEDTYNGNGIIPDHIDKVKLRKNRITAPSDSGHGRAGVGNPMHSNLLAGINEMLGSRSQVDHQATVPKVQFEAILQENQALKLKLVDMQQQITDLRRMNDTLYEQNCNFRKKSIV